MEWRKQEMQVIRTLYPTQPAEKMQLFLPGRSVKAIRRMASELKVGKQVHAPKNWRPIGSERMDRGYLIRKVTDTRQPKKDWKRVDVIDWEAINGPVPEGMVLVVKANGLKPTPENLVPVPRELQLLKSRQATAHPLGKEKVKNGVLVRKVAMTGDFHTDWKRTDAILWESVHGPVPPDKVLMAIDNSKPRTLDNLALFTREEHMRRATFMNYPPEVVELYRLKGQITRIVNTKARKAESEKSEPT